MPKAAYTLSWSAAAQAYELSGPQNAEARFIVPDSPAWFAWLAEVPSFAFRGQAGSYTARLEAVQRGERYWYAYLRTGQKLCKKYLGKAADLTVARLEQVARLLQAERASGVPPATALPAQQEQHEPPLPQIALTPAHRTAAEPASVVEGQPDGQAAMHSEPFTPLLATQLHVPQSPARLVHRARLIERLKLGLSQTLLLLSAPAGFGKTTLLAEFLAKSGVPAAWLSLDPEDNDPLRFLSSLLAAFQTRDPALGASARALLSSPHGLQGLSLSAVFALLINDLASRNTGEFLLVLDDYHTITVEPIQHAMASLVTKVSPGRWQRRGRCC